MFRFRASLDPGEAAAAFSLLINSAPAPDLLLPALHRLRSIVAPFRAAAPAPWPAPGLHVTPETSYQSELWLPLAEIRPLFERFYRTLLRYPPVLASSPFATAGSWASIAAALPPFAAGATLPDRLLERLLVDLDLRVKFLCWSFMPRRFYGSGDNQRYPSQVEWIGEWCKRTGVAGKVLRCLDAACGAGVSTYALARLLLENGRGSGGFRVEGWTLDPLEACCAAHGSFPHDPGWSAAFRTELVPLVRQQAFGAIEFSAVDLLKDDLPGGGYDLILCNGLVGGPLLNLPEELERVTGRLARLLAPGGILLVADRFHGGWKKKCPQAVLRALLQRYGLTVAPDGGGEGAMIVAEAPVV